MAEPLFLYILSVLERLPFGVAGACRVDGFALLRSFVLIRADALCNTLVCRDPPDIESRFELALGRVIVAVGTVLGGERRCRYVLLVVGSLP